MKVKNTIENTKTLGYAICCIYGNVYNVILPVVQESNKGSVYILNTTKSDKSEVYNQLAYKFFGKPVSLSCDLYKDFVRMLEVHENLWIEDDETAKQYRELYNMVSKNKPLLPLVQEDKRGKNLVGLEGDIIKFHIQEKISGYMLDIKGNKIPTKITTDHVATAETLYKWMKNHKSDREFTKISCYSRSMAKGYSEEDFPNIFVENDNQYACGDIHGEPYVYESVNLVNKMHVEYDLIKKKYNGKQFYIDPFTKKVLSVKITTEDEDESLGDFTDNIEEIASLNLEDVKVFESEYCSQNYYEKSREIYKGRSVTTYSIRGKQWKELPKEEEWDQDQRDQSYYYMALCQGKWFFYPFLEEALKIKKKGRKEHN